VPSMALLQAATTLPNLPPSRVASETKLPRFIHSLVPRLCPREEALRAAPARALILDSSDPSPVTPPTVLAAPRPPVGEVADSSSICAKHTASASFAVISCPFSLSVANLTRSRSLSLCDWPSARANRTNETRGLCLCEAMCLVFFAVVCVSKYPPSPVLGTFAAKI